MHSILAALMTAFLNSRPDISCRVHPGISEKRIYATSSIFSSNISFSHAVVASSMFPDLMFLR
jgi:Ca2+/Na+ antiporter